MTQSVEAFEDQGLHKGLTWTERASLGELAAVLSPDGSARRNQFLHCVHLKGAYKALSLRKPPGTLLDFGCGTGRFVRFFASKGYNVIGTEVTDAMLQQARHFGLPANASLLLTDGVSIPVPDQSVDILWICGVLRLVAQQPVFKQITAEMFRVLKPGSFVVNVEVSTQWDPTVFNAGFESAGFKTQSVKVLHRYGRFDRIFKSNVIPSWALGPMARGYATFRGLTDDPNRAVQGEGRRDYLMVWKKPA